MSPLSRWLPVVVCLGLLLSISGDGSAQDSTNPVTQSMTNSIGMKLQLIPAGEFLMGSTPTDIQKTLTFDPAIKSSYCDDEMPQHRVRISKSFYMGAHEVTKQQFAQFVNATGYVTDGEKNGKGGLGWNAAEGKFDGPKLEYTWKNTGFPYPDDYPVTNVSWNDAVAFCKWLSDKEGKNSRLPTEGEWEYACRTGTTTLYSFGDDPELLALYGNSRDGTAHEAWPDDHGLASIKAKDNYQFLAPSGFYKPNQWGLYDMHGNVSDWCQDAYIENAYQERPELTIDPFVDGAPQRVLRGGSAYLSPSSERSANRYKERPDFVDPYFGFRVAMTK